MGLDWLIINLPLPEHTHIPVSQCITVLYVDKYIFAETEDIDGFSEHLEYYNSQPFYICRFFISVARPQVLTK